MDSVPTSVSAAADARRKGFRGSIVTPDDPDYEAARHVWNGMIDRRPAIVLRARSVSDVQIAVSLARETSLPLAVRGGGHGLPGFGTCDDGIVLDLGELREVVVDEAERTARVGGGATWADVDAATHAHGLATPGGLVSTTGAGGLTLGGGMGWLARAYGLSCDNVLSAQLVVASGEVVTAGPTEHPELYWAIRGGGGNFGVVTEFEFALHPVSAVTGGLVLFPLARAVEVGRAYRRWVDGLSDRLTTMLVFLTAPDAEFVPVALRGEAAVAIAGCHIGSADEAERDLASIRALGPAADVFDVLPYPDLQRFFDDDVPAGRRYYMKGLFGTMPDDAVETIAARMVGRPSEAIEVDVHHLGGAVARVGEDATAFADRSSPFTFNVYSIWDDPAADEANRDWVRGLTDALGRFGSGRAYVNFATDREAVGRVEAAYGTERHERLVEVKRRWDPGNLFRINQNIQP
ncbi:MAG TPA: FAD-binding oxidoreductase [Candidatus Limnocylindrales bacterium]